MGMSDLSAGKLGSGHQERTADKALRNLEAKGEERRSRLG